ncbi:hypothetical protein A6M21_05305 [Desulfotomaculum copahuensis]|uniref:Uncharacterized protein n=1 Tax=Desulfotomaculum copahuensis TaxID=1838280 RepID=A0A1B7LHX6_9FIRM|nr:hypothetical protein A6M21_05305 [Desulfotomaculum copahuensis]
MRISRVGQFVPAGKKWPARDEQCFHADPGVKCRFARPDRPENVPLCAPPARGLSFYEKRSCGAEMNAVDSGVISSYNLSFCRSY